ncbi:MAG: hypothetical protein JW750_12260 [Anaerolineaceae bacterium]|nr:hypothetical protein [Anaerolineaceae bacterium]
MPVIKRYSNRKLYDTEARHYVTLDEIAEMVQRGEDVRVVEHLTGIDLTAATMTQILNRQEKLSRGIVPQPLLERLVELSGETLNSMRESMKAFLDPVDYFARELTRRTDELLAMGRIDQSEQDRLIELLLASDLTPGLISTESGEEGATMEELQSLLDQLDALEQEMDRLQQARVGSSS